MGFGDYLKGPQHKAEAIRANYDAVVEVVHAAPAEQYRESLRLAMPLASIQESELAAAGF